MSEEGRNFLARWSRRKAAARVAPAEPPDVPPPDLPPIESLGPDSDYSVFLARGVSRAIQAQALGVAWASDPAIADFRGMAEYAWDFNAPGYGELAGGDNAAVWLSQIVRSGATLAVEDKAPPLEGEGGGEGPTTHPNCPVAPSPNPSLKGRGTESVPATLSAEPTPALTTRRRHGGAVPA